MPERPCRARPACAPRPDPDEPAEQRRQVRRRSHPPHRPGHDGQVEVRVTDAGPGVPPAFRAHLFQRFSRDAGTAQQVMGTGLGLFIARELARANHGDIMLRDRNPSGSVFVLALPQAL
ncbi:MAG: sensor histidine kinase [Nocardioidaceae bacterium]